MMGDDADGGQCAVQNCSLDAIGDGIYVCGIHVHAYPPSLVKAAGDYFDYALQLSNGTVLTFRRATLHGVYATLHNDEGAAYPTTAGKTWTEDKFPLAYPCPRGVDVRISEIVWCADAPEGS